MHTPITIQVNKAQHEASGLYLYKDQHNRILINGIYNGVFQNTKLKPLMEILSVNGISCEGMSDGFVVSLIDEAEGTVTVVARDVNDNNNICVAQPVTTNQQQAHGINNNHNVDFSLGASSQQQQQQPLLGNDMKTYPPPGCSPGGEWRQSRYPGNNTAILCVILACVFGPYSLCGLVAYCCPQDVMDVYVHQGNVFDIDGILLGDESKFTLI